jgi:hypothetical protein
MLGLASWAYGSADAALAHLRRERISIRPPIASLGQAQAGQRIRIEIEVVNRVDRTIRVIGGTSDCSCVTTMDLPTSLAPREARRITVVVRLPSAQGVFQRRAFIWTEDRGRAGVVWFDLSARIDAASSEH